MVGDRLYTDIALGRLHGVTAILVLTGETQQTDVDAAQPAQRPVVEEEKLLTVAFRIHVTKAQLDGLGSYMKANCIKPERI